jgi:hypothetical protein
LEITSLADDIAARGIVVPHTSGYRINLWEHLFIKDISASTQMRRIQEILSLQETYLGKVIRKVKEPQVIGVVLYFIPLRFYNRQGGNGDANVLKGLPYEAWIKWHRGKPSALHVNLIELVPPAQVL